MGRKAATQGDSLAFGSLVAFLAYVYVTPGEWVPWLEKWRLALVTSLLATVLLVLGRLHRRAPLEVDGPRGWLLGSFVALAWASLGWSLYAEATHATAVELAKSLAIYLTLVNLVTTERRLRVACLAMVLASLVTSHGALEWYQVGEDMVEGYRTRWVGVYADPNRMAMSLGLIVPLALAFLVRRENGVWVRVACAVAGAMAVAAMVLSYSRGGFLGLVTAAGVWLLLERRPRRTALVGALAVMMFVASPESFWTRTQSVSTFEEDASAMSRVEAWTVTANVNASHPLLGVGAGTFIHAWRVYGPPTSHQAYAAHNIFLQVISDLGLVGLALFLGFLGAVLGPLVESAGRREEAWLARGLAAALAGYLVTCLFAGFLVGVHLYVLLGLGASAERVLRVRSEVSRPSLLPASRAL